MHHDTSQPWRLHLQGRLHVWQGWLMADRQRVLQGRFECLLAEIEQVQRRVRAASPADACDSGVAPRQLTA
jgi:hypothetical protein